MAHANPPGGGKEAAAPPEKFDPLYQWLGIPPRDQPPDHYRLLGIELFEANEEVIAHAADRQMGHVRTFQTGVRGPASQDVLNQIAAARRCLLDSQRKLAYDVELAGRNLGRLEKDVDGTAFGEYLLLDMISRGSLGPVFKAKHRTMGRVVALKVLNKHAAQIPAVVEQFCRHISLLARLDHPNLITAFDAGNRGGRPYLTMEYVDGSSLDHRIRSAEPPSVEETVNYIKQAAGGLAYTHQQGVAHGSVCPQNLLITPEHIVKLTGFGNASFLRPSEPPPPRAEDGGDGEHLPRVVSVHEFVAPEQALGLAVDDRSDIYSLGCTLYAALVGEAPYAGSSPIDKLLAHHDRPLPRAGLRRSDIPAALDDVLARMTAKQPEARYGSMYDVIVALTAAMQGRRTAPVPPAPNTAPPASESAPGPLDSLGQIAQGDVPRWKRKR